MANLEKIGKLLSKVRKELNYSQDDVAKEINIKRELLSYYENGKREIPLTHLSNLSKFYNKSINFFLNDEIIEEPELKISYRKESLTEEDNKKIEWAKKFVENLYELRNL